MRWIPISERLPEGADAVSCEAWCDADEDNFAGPCVMMFNGQEWHSREDTGCWEPGPVTHWRPRPTAPKGAPAVSAPSRDEIMAKAVRWHDDNTLGGEDCEHRQLELIAYVEGYSSAIADGVRVEGGTNDE